MKIQNKYVVCFKTVVTRDVFICYLMNSENDSFKKLIISESSLKDTDVRLVIKKLINIFSYKNFIFCGYNNGHYDNAIINYIFGMQRTWSDAADVKEVLFSLNRINDIILNEDVEQWKHYKYGRNFRAFDLMTMNFSKRERISLQEVKFSLEIDHISAFSDKKTEEELDKDIYSDVIAINELLKRSKELIDVRLEFNNEYNIGTLSLDNVSLGKKIFEKIYKEGQETNGTDTKKKIERIVCFNDIILPFIHFESEQLQSILDEAKTVKLDTENPTYEKQFVYNGSKISMGLGGLHSICKPEEVIPSNDELLVSIDVESMFPTLVSKYRIYPEFLTEKFLNTYNKLLEERLKAKHEGNVQKNNVLKRLLVSMVGMFNNPNDNFYDPVSYYKITINSQFLLLMLAERLVMNLQCRIVNWNTDGLFVLINKKYRFRLEQFVKQFEYDTELHFKYEFLEGLYQVDVNNYFAVKAGFNSLLDKERVEMLDDFLVCKGLFCYKRKLGRAQNATIIPESVIYKCLFNKPIEETVKDKKGLMSFTLFSKMDSQGHAFFNNNEIGNVNRYYYSQSGGYINRGSYVSGSINISPITDIRYCVSLLNDIEDNIKINYNYYIGQANMLLQKFHNNQLKLF